MKKVLPLICILILALFTLTSCAGDAKPSREAVKASLASVIEDQLGEGNEEAPAKAKAYAECVVDEAYDDLSARTLNKIVEAKTITEVSNIEGSEDERTALDNAAEKCQGKLLAESDN